MSVLPSDAHAELAQLLSALQSPDNNVRSQAEDHLTNNWTNTKPELLLMGLVEQAHESNDATVRINWKLSSVVRGEVTDFFKSLQTRSFAAVIFRRIASKSRKLDNNTTVELFLALPKAQGYAIRQKLLEALSAEKTNVVRNKIGDAVAEIAREYSDNSAFFVEAFDTPPMEG